MRRVVLALVLSLAIAPAFADKGGRGNDDDLHEARQRGEVMPLAVILERIRPEIGDRIIEIETDRKSGVILYEIYYLDESGRRREIEIDARTGEIRRMEDED